MEKMKKYPKIFNLILVIVSVVYSIDSIKNGQLYESLIKLSLIPVLYVPYILRLFKVRISDSSILIYSIFIFFGHFLGSIVGLYGKIYCYDTIIHTLFGFLFSFFALEFIIKQKIFNNKKVIINGIIILSIVALLSGLWETFEFTCDDIFNKDAQRVLLTGVNDTMKDIIVAYLGSLLFITMYAYEYMNNKKLIIKSFIDSI